MNIHESEKETALVQVGALTMTTSPGEKTVITVPLNRGARHSSFPSEESWRRGRPSDDHPGSMD